MEDKKDRFRRLANKRVVSALKAIKLVENLSNKNNYSYSDEEYKTMIKALKEALSTTERSFSGNNKPAIKDFLSEFQESTEKSRGKANE